MSLREGSESSPEASSAVIDPQSDTHLEVSAVSSSPTEAAVVAANGTELATSLPSDSLDLQGQSSRAQPSTPDREDPTGVPSTAVATHAATDDTTVADGGYEDSPTSPNVAPTAPHAPPAPDTSSAVVVTAATHEGEVGVTDSPSPPQRALTPDSESNTHDACAAQPSPPCRTSLNDTEDGNPVHTRGENEHSLLVGVRVKRSRDDDDDDDGPPTRKQPHAVDDTPTAALPWVSDRDDALLPDATTRAQVGQLQRLLLSLFPASVRRMFETHYADAAVAHTLGDSDKVSADESQPRLADSRAPRKQVRDEASALGEGEEVITAQAAELLELLDDVAEDKLFVRAAWQRCQDAHQLRRQKLSKRRQQSTMSRLTGSSSTSQRRRRQQQRQRQGSLQGHEPDDGESSPRGAEDSPLDVFHFMEWDASSCWRHYDKKRRAAHRRGPPPSSNPSPFLNAVDQDREEYAGIVARQLGNDAVPVALPVTLPMILPEKEEENYARYVLSNGKLRRDCLEPFQYLSARVGAVRDQVLGLGGDATAGTEEV